MANKPSEYGGSDTVKTQGIQPDPHQMTASEQLRVMYNKDPVDNSMPDPIDTPRHIDVEPTQIP